MRHKVDEFHSFRQSSSGSCQVASSDCTFTPTASIPNQNGRLCLPLLSETQKVTWVYSDQINLQLDGVVELDAAFDRFPYLTQKQTVALAKRCSLHPDQVKVWFMVQRLRYGISWDYKDILEMQRKLTLSRDKEEAHDRKKVADETRRDEKKEVKESGGKKGGKKKMMKDKVEKETTKQGNEKEWPASIQTQKNLSTGEKKGSKANKRSHSDMVLGSGPDPSKNPSPTSEITPGLKTVVSPVNSSAHRNTDIKSSAKTRSQLAVMRSVFCNSQYPDAVEYDHLALTTGLQHQVLVQWFNDTRYRIKKVKPHWMNEEQHSIALANIRCQQYLRALEKARMSEADIRHQTKTEEEKLS
ncbi:homeobox and leucine zipper encoding b [Sphaeramia orbicularis]|uniref:homeobox and leucine zipper encoding b n=1 Tax=Sphaeramia orbicularis TaxID=375764 RepID=UPI00117FC16B|nr:zinc fingers and homeoboxes protein 1-like [Sphaeramia orbicularis]